ncbi:hypothetical protein FQ087_03220 [Sporosarcina sp. ANT_H38]|uniref:hypothetical protein n=1 Tax=Sporosarcina sp. ANT_H38 TaxID=2597358 RepID=UPI0011F14ED8|nr:hypothetical protein [Sporosarcina sp. ANT_H38]KAA0965332.1 hypothetical protein FQ087_03220 [Sporosarcina sp. ANT_H38]
MEKKQWSMQESFYFPEHAGVPTGVQSVTVTPRYTEERTEDAVRLTGIYHIAANVEFDEGVQRSAELDDSFILIDDVEVDGKDGYFEYAVPLNIDLPSIAESPLDIVTTQATGETDGQGTYGVVWNVECTYTEAVAIVEELEEVQVVVATPIVVIDSTSFDEMDEVLSFIADLTDGVSTTSFRSNDVFVKNEG